jgi:uncharacterized protein (TIGR03000 family)
MRKALAAAVCSCLLPLSASGADVIMPDGTPVSQLGGLIIARQGNQTTISLGGILLPRKVRTKTATPDGPVITRFTLPSTFHSPARPDWLGTAPATIQVDIPDAYGLIYVEGQKVASDTARRRYLESPPLAPGKDYVLQLRAAFSVGNQVIVEDRRVTVRAGQTSNVAFDGSQPIAVVDRPSQR